MSYDEIVMFLEKAGLSNYEARAYLAALDKQPLNGYRLSQMTGIPRSKIYETIEKLISKNLFVSQEGEHNLVTAVDFTVFLNKIEKQNSDTITYLREQLPKVTAVTNEGIWNIKGRKNILEKVSEMIREAENYVYIQTMGDDIPLLKDAILSCQQNKVPLWGIYCGKSKIIIENMFQHLGDTCNTISEIAVCVDGNKALIGFTEPDQLATAALTGNRALISITIQYIKHELFLDELNKGKDKDALKTYTEKYRAAMAQWP